MKVEFNSLHWDNVDRTMLDAHASVMDSMSIPVNYHNVNINHGQWMDHVVRTSTSDVIVVIEPDCIPLDKEKLFSYISYAYKKSTFVGIAQVSNHIPPKSHIYAAPGLFIIHKPVYDKLGKPSFSETQRSDTAEELCYIAEEKGVRYRALLPTYFEKEPSEGLWPLGPLGYYGIGTVFDNAVYHLYQSRKAENIELFVTRCKQVVNGTFSTQNFYPSAIFNYEGNIVK